VFFYLNGFDEPGIYSFMLIIKIIGWIFSVAIYFMFYQNTAYFFKNQGISFKRIMTNLIFYDLALLLATLMILLVWQNFL